MLIEGGSLKPEPRFLPLPAPRRKTAASVVAAFWTAIFVAPWLRDAIQSPSRGWDFPVFYIAAKLPLRLLYNRDAFSAYWRIHLQPLGSPHWAAYVRPSVFSLLLRPLAAFSYTPAMRTWMAFGFAAYLLSLLLLLRRFRISPLLLPAFACFFPAMQGMFAGGDTTFYLLALVVGLLLLEGGYDSLAGLCLVLCLCKFNLVLLLPAMLAVHRRLRALTAFSLGAVFVAGASCLMTPLHEYVSAIVQAQESTAGFFPVGLRGAAFALGCEWCYPILAAVTVGICVWLMRHLRAAEALSVAITGSLMISPYVCWYDTTLLAFPIIVIWASSGKALRLACVLVLIAGPLWSHGGGFMQRPGGYMHIGVEVAILAYYVCAVRTACGRDPSLSNCAAAAYRIRQTS